MGGAGGGAGGGEPEELAEMLARECRRELVERCNALARPLARHTFRAQSAPFIVRPSALVSPPAYLHHTPERLGFGYDKPITQGAIWIHAVSVWAVVAAMPLIRW